MEDNSACFVPFRCPLFHSLCFSLNRYLVSIDGRCLLYLILPHIRKPLLHPKPDKTNPKKIIIMISVINYHLSFIAH
jgi:hypothetical protein